MHLIMWQFLLHMLRLNEHQQLVLFQNNKSPIFKFFHMHLHLTQ
jgi:hypothetical protein